MLYGQSPCRFNGIQLPDISIKTNYKSKICNFAVCFTKLKMMLRMKITILLILISASLKAPNDPAIAIPAGEVINGYERIWNAICQVESSGNIYAIGDKHLNEKSYGIAQIRQVRLDDFYNQSGVRYSTDDMFCPDKSKEVFLWYASGYNVNQVEAISRAWNGGEKGMNKPVTKKYYLKVKSIL